MRLRFVTGWVHSIDLIRCSLIVTQGVSVRL
jgi:hypothetical protein